LGALLLKKEIQERNSFPDSEFSSSKAQQTFVTSSAELAQCAKANHLPATQSFENFLFHIFLPTGLLMYGSYPKG